MSFIYIDTRERGFANLGYLNDKNFLCQRLSVPLGGLVAVLKKYLSRFDLAKAQGIIVVSGPGPFSSIRNGVLVANLLSRILRKPLYAVSGLGDINVQNIFTDIKSGHLKPIKYVEPIYDAEPNITMSKHNI